MIYVIAGVILSLDQAAKFFITHKLLLNQSVPVINGIFHLTLVHNRGAAFGIFKNHIYLFVLTSILAIILIVRGFKNAKCSLYNISLALILSGAAGNLIDRLLFGYVVDFLDFRVWPVFNIADSAITVGAVILGWSILTKRNKNGSV